MTTIVTRAGKGSALSWNEVDANFTNLNTNKAETNSPTFTGTVSGITATMVGLGNVDNTSDATKNAASVTLTNKILVASTNTVEATSGPNTSQLAFRNILINGEVTRINQRGIVNWAAVSNGMYGYDRWKKIDASNMTQIIEKGNFKPSTVYTLSGVGVTTQQITSPSSGNWTLPNIPITATNVQVEEGLKATPFELRPSAYELMLCQRYFCTFFVTAGSAYPTAGAAEAVSAFFFPVQMRIAPTITPGVLGVNNNIASDSFSYTTIMSTGGTYAVVQGGAAGNFRGARFDNRADAEI